MSNGWFGRPRRRPGTIDLRRRWESEERLADQTLYALIGINVAVFLLWHLGPPMLGVFMQENFLVSAEAVAHFRVWTLVTHAFSQIDPQHLLFNLIGLWSFGQVIARAYGWRDLLIVYLGGAIASGAGFVLYQLITGDPNPELGASGAVMAISVLFAASFPDRRILVMFVLPLSAPMAVGLFILLDLLGLFGVGGGTVAHASHLAGAAWGLAFWWWRTQRRS